MRTIPILIVTSCATAGTFQRADTMGPGGWELGADLSAGVLLSAASSSDTTSFALPRVAARVGLSETVELGGSVGMDGVRVAPKVQVTPDDGLIVSVAPGLRVLPIPNPNANVGVLVGVEEAVLIGGDLSEVTHLVGVVRSAQDVGFSENTGVLVWVGGSFGASFQVAPWLRVMPEVGLMSPVLVIDEGSAIGPQGALVQGGVGVVFGQRRD